MKLRGLLMRAAAMLASLLLPLVVSAAEPEGGDAATYQKTDSRAGKIHHIGIYDYQGNVIKPGDPNAQPYSPYQTCGRCHDVNAISHGWHFNAPLAGVDKGRRGEPWWLVDKETTTQVPVSSRKWEGSYKPEEMGITSWQWLQRFGRHFPGGGIATPARHEKDDEAKGIKRGQLVLDPQGNPIVPDPKFVGAEAARGLTEPPAKSRWRFSGVQEIDCMICHAQSLTHDPEAYANAIKQENLKWAPTIAAGLGTVTGTAKGLRPPPPPRPAPATSPAGTTAAAAAPPADPTLPLKYNLAKFDNSGYVHFDVVRAPAADRCYYCHSTRTVGDNAPPPHTLDQDIHMRAGMNCTDCHRHDIGHAVTRGYEGEVKLPGNAAGAMSCRGCHMGDHNASDMSLASGGRLGAPVPLHKGLPPLHLERLACTACHSGPWPDKDAKAVQTSLAHGLGMPASDRTPKDLPLIVAPIFLWEQHGDRRQITPMRMAWPSYFARQAKDGTLHPFAPKEVSNSFENASVTLDPAKQSALTDKQVANVLNDLKENGKGEGEAVYVRNGRIFKATGKDTAVGTVDSKADPYTWALGHDVRPASQSLGVRGCTDCHAPDAPIYFGNIASPVAADASLPAKTMADLRNDNQTLAKIWAWSFGWRTVFKIVAMTATALLGTLLLVYAFIGLTGLMKRLARR